VFELLVQLKAASITAAQQSSHYLTQVCRLVVLLSSLTLPSSSPLTSMSSVIAGLDTLTWQLMWMC